MNFKAAVTIMPNSKGNNKKGQELLNSLGELNITNISDVLVGKHFVLELEANSKNAAAAFVEEACKSLLANEKSEVFDFTVEEV